MKKTSSRFLSVALLLVLLLSLALTGCGETAEAPATPPAQQGQSVSGNPITTPDDRPVSAPGEHPDASAEDTGFVKDGKVYITDCVFIGLEGKINGYGWTAWAGKSKLAAKELINYKSSDDVKESSIAQALDRAFKPVITSHPDCKDGYTLEGLKNNDVITWTYEVDEDMFNKLKSYVTGIEFVVTDGRLTVDSLIEAMEVDPFADPGFFGIEYSDSRDTWILTVTNLCDNAGVELEVEIDNMGHTGPWQNGDSFKVKILTSAEQLKEYGYIFTQTEGTITITWM